MYSIGDFESDGVDTGEQTGGSCRSRTAGRGFAWQAGMGANDIVSISAQSSAPPSGRPRAPAQVIVLASYRQRVADVERDRILDAEWNRLSILVAEALCWRDPESVEVVEACVTRLERLVRADWGEDWGAR